MVVSYSQSLQYPSVPRSSIYYYDWLTFTRIKYFPQELNCAWNPKVLETLIKYFFEPYPKVVAAVFVIAYFVRLAVKLIPKLAETDTAWLGQKLFGSITAFTVFGAIAFLALMSLTSYLVSEDIMYKLLKALFVLSGF
jgi:hypothetical protein